MYLGRYHQIKISGSGVYYVLRRHDLNRFPRNAKRRSPGPYPLASTGRGIEHVYIKPHRPYLTGKVERSHRTDEEEFYQLLEYTDDVDSNKKLEEGEKFYNLRRPHSSHCGKMPYEVLRSKLGSNFPCQP